MRGRPVNSMIRQNMIEILYFLGQGYGYEIYKIYREIFPSATMRVMYYHLQKGVELKEFKIAKIDKVEGNYSWGDKAEKRYYTLDENAEPRADEKVRDYIQKYLAKQEKDKILRK